MFACIKYQLPHLIESGGGAIVNISGTAALLGSATPQIAYDAAKAGQLALTRDVAVGMHEPESDATPFAPVRSKAI